MGRYKQWNGLLEWNTGLDYWTELFSFFGQVSVLFLKEPYFLRSWVQTLIVTITTSVYCSIFQTKSYATVI